MFECKIYLWEAYTYYSYIRNENYCMKIFFMILQICLQNLLLGGTDRAQSTFNPGIFPVTVTFTHKGNNMQRKLDCFLKIAVWSLLRIELIEERGSNKPSEDFYFNLCKCIKKP